MSNLEDVKKTVAAVKPKASKKAQPGTFNAISIEKHFTKELTRNILADTKDLRQSYVELMDNKDPYVLYGNYDNFLQNEAITDSKAKIKTKSYVTLATEVKQYFTLIFEKMLKEVSNIDPKDLAVIESMSLGEDEERVLQQIATESNKVELKTVALRDKKIKLIVDKALLANDVCFIKFVSEIANSVRLTPGSNLATASDPTGYFGEKITQLIAKEQKECVLLPTLLETLFTRFVKAISFKISRQLWFNYNTVNQNFIDGLFSLCGIDYNILMELKENLREKEVKPKKVVKPTETPNGKAEIEEPVAETKK